MTKFPSTTAKKSGTICLRPSKSIPCNVLCNEICLDNILNMLSILFLHVSGFFLVTPLLEMHATQLERIEMMNNLLLYLQNPADSGLNGLETPVVFEMDNAHVLRMLIVFHNHNLVGLKVQFEKPETLVYQPVNFVLQFQCFAPVPFRVDRMDITFSDPDYSFCVIDPTRNVQYSEQDLADYKPENRSNMDLTLKPSGTYTSIKFPMTIKKKQELQCLQVSLWLGNAPNAVCFQWKMIDNKYHLTLLKNYDYRLEIGQEALVERPVIKYDNMIFFTF